MTYEDIKEVTEVAKDKLKEKCEEMYKTIKERIMMDKRNDLSIISLTKLIKIS